MAKLRPIAARQAHAAGPATLGSAAKAPSRRVAQLAEAGLAIGKRIWRDAALPLTARHARRARCGAPRPRRRPAAARSRPPRARLRHHLGPRPGGLDHQLPAGVGPEIARRVERTARARPPSPPPHAAPRAHLVSPPHAAPARRRQPLSKPQRRSGAVNEHRLGVIAALPKGARLAPALRGPGRLRGTTCTCRASRKGGGPETFSGKDGEERAKRQVSRGVRNEMRDTEVSTVEGRRTSCGSLQARHPPGDASAPAEWAL